MYAKNREDWNKVKLFNETKRCEKITCVRRVDIKAHEKKKWQISFALLFMKQVTGIHYHSKGKWRGQDLTLQLGKSS